MTSGTPGSPEENTTDGTSDEPENEAEIKLFQDTKEKIKSILQNSIFRHVKCLGDHSMNHYCNLIEKYFTINEGEWKDLKKEISEKAAKGSHVSIKVIHGSLPSVKKNDNIKVRAFITHPSVSPEPLSKIIEGDVADENDFGIDGKIQLPKFDGCVTRVEIVKVKSEGIVNVQGVAAMINPVEKTTIVGFNEIPLTTIPTENAFENLYVLSRPEVGLFSLKDDPGRLRLRLQKTIQEEEDPNQTIPQILSEYFFTKCCYYLNIEPEPQENSSRTTNVRYKLDVEQNKTSDLKVEQFHTMVCKDQESKRSFQTFDSFLIDCILSNRIILGSEKTRKTSRGMMFVPTSKSPSVSPSRSSSLLSIPDAAASSSSSRRKQSQAQSEQHKSVLDYLTTLGELRTMREYSESSREMFWDLQIGVDTDSPDFPLTKEELTQIYSLALSNIVTRLDNPQAWNGKLPNTLNTIMKMLTSCSDVTRHEMQCSIGQAFIETFLKVNFHDILLTEHIDILAEAHDEEDAPECLKNFSRSCLSFLEIHLLDLENERLYAVLQNIKILLSHNYLSISTLEEAMIQRHQSIFKGKVKSKEKDIRQKYPDKSLNKIELCEEVLNLIIIELHHFPAEEHQVLFDGVVDYQLLRSKTYLGLCEELVRSSLPEKIKIPYKAYSEEDPRVKDLTYTLGCFRAIKRLSETIYPGEKLPDWVFDMFEKYPQLWIQHLTISKTETYLENMLRYVRENNTEGPPSVPQHGDSISRTQSNEDIILETLRAFNDISTGCWRDWKDITGCWPKQTLRVGTGLLLIKSLGQFEKILLDQFGRIHLIDGELCVKELCEIIKLLEGLLSNHKKYHKQIHDEVKSNLLIYQFINYL